MRETEVRDERRGEERNGGVIMQRNRKRDGKCRCGSTWI